MSDLAVKYLIDFTFKYARENIETVIPEIFGDAKIDPLSAVYGKRMIDQAKNWLKTTNIPVALGFDVVEAQMPMVTVQLSSSAPSQPVLGDYGLPSQEPLMAQEKQVILPSFQPGNIIYNSDNSALILTPPSSMTPDQTALFLPGLIIRDANANEYPLSMDQDGNILIVAGNKPLDQLNSSSLEVISPVLYATYNGGAMVFDENITVVVHGHSNRAESLFLYLIVMYGLLKFRPLLLSTFGLDLSTPHASDLNRDDAFLGENVWRRFITLSCKAVYSWEGTRQQDILGLLLTVFNGQST